MTRRLLKRQKKENLRHRKCVFFLLPYRNSTLFLKLFEVPQAPLPPPYFIPFRRYTTIILVVPSVIDPPLWTLAYHSKPSKSFRNKHLPIFKFSLNHWGILIAELFFNFSSQNLSVELRRETRYHLIGRQLQMPGMLCFWVRNSDVTWRRRYLGRYAGKSQRLSRLECAGPNGQMDCVSQPTSDKKNQQDMMKGRHVR